MNVRFACLRMAAVVLPALALAGTPVLRAAEEKADPQPATKEKAVAAKKPRAEPRGRLPFYYGQVVAPDQKGSW